MVFYVFNVWHLVHPSQQSKNLRTMMLYLYEINVNFVVVQNTLWKNKKTLTILFRQINSLVICLVNALLSRKFCQKSVRVYFRNFHTTMLFQQNEQLSFQIIIVIFVLQDRPFLFTGSSPF